MDEHYLEHRHDFCALRLRGAGRAWGQLILEGELGTKRAKMLLEPEGGIFGTKKGANFVEDVHFRSFALI